jgi:hypothetical protein
MNMQMLMQQAKKMQKDMEKAQEELSKMSFTSKQPLVEVTINGNFELTNIKISEEITSDDIEVLQDMILLSFNDAVKQATQAKESKLGNVGSGLAGLF